MKRIKTKLSNTKLKGIHEHKHKIKNKFEARFNYKGQSTYIGSYPSSFDAYKARMKFILDLI